MTSLQCSFSAFPCSCLFKIVLITNYVIQCFRWLDKLGVAAANGVDLVFRQSFYGGKYGLVDRELNPTPVSYVEFNVFVQLQTVLIVV